MNNIFTLQDFDNLDFFKFGRSSLINGELIFSEHAMYDLHYNLDKNINSYDLMDSKSKPTLIRPSFKRALMLLDDTMRPFLLNKFNHFLTHLKQTEGLDFFNAFLVVSPNSVKPHIHSGVVFEQTYVMTQKFEKINSQFCIGENEKNDYIKFDFIEEEYFLRLHGFPVPHSVLCSDNNLKFYFVFEYNRPAKTDYCFNKPIVI